MGRGLKLTARGTGPPARSLVKSLPWSLPLPRSLQIDQMFQIILLLFCWISALNADDLLRVESEGSGDDILVNAPASIGKGRPGGHGGGGSGGGHHGGKPPKGSWNCCLFAKSYCKLPCHGKLCTQTCTVKCFPFGWVTCDPIPCQEANPWGCIGTTTTATTTTSTTTQLPQRQQRQQPQLPQRQQQQRPQPRQDAEATGWRSGTSVSTLRLARQTT